MVMQNRIREEISPNHCGGLGVINLKSVVLGGIILSFPTIAHLTGIQSMTLTYRAPGLIQGTANCSEKKSSITLGSIASSI